MAELLDPISPGEILQEEFLKLNGYREIIKFG